MNESFPSPLHAWHEQHNARFGSLNETEIVSDYGDGDAEYAALTKSVGVLDFSFRGRACLLGADRARFLHGQVTNDIKRLRAGEGCYAALVTAKGKMESDLNIFCLPDEILLDFEPGLTSRITQRLEKYIVADDVQVVDVAPLYGLFHVCGPKAPDALRDLKIFSDLPAKEFSSVNFSDAELGQIYLMKNSRIGSGGFDLFLPTQAIQTAMEKLVAAAKNFGGRACGWTAFEAARIESGIPRFGADMDESNLPLECGIETRAVSYNKGCYIGQEIINRIHTIGHVNRELRGLRLADDLKTLPARGHKLLRDDNEVGFVTSAIFSPAVNGNIALGYVRREASTPGTQLQLVSNDSTSAVKILELPFAKPISDAS